MSRLLGLADPDCPYKCGLTLVYVGAGPRACPDLVGSLREMGTCYDPNRHHRRSVRLDGYDYREPGAYFVTIVTQGRACVFGEVVDGVMRLNDAGRMVRTVWDEMPIHYPGVQTDEFVVMPNHILGMIVLRCDPAVGAAPSGRPESLPATTAPPEPGQTQRIADTLPGQPQGVAPTLSLPDVMHRFKTMTTKRYVDGVKRRGWPAFPGRLWQRNYYEHIMRNNESLTHIRQYVLENPARWHEDPENPTVTTNYDHML